MATCEWKIYYSGGETYSNLDGPASAAQKTDVQAVAQTHEEHGHHVEHTTDYYVYYDTGLWRGVDIFGLWDYLAQAGSKVVLFGRWVSNEEYAEIIKRALHDPDLPKRSAWKPNGQERRPS